MPVAVPETTFVGSAVPVIDHVAFVNGVPLKVPVIDPPVPVYLRVDALAANGPITRQANAPTIKTTRGRRANETMDLFMSESPCVCVYG